MGKRDFDNLLKVIKSDHAAVANTIVSEEIDLELPRGFIAKIRKIVWLFTSVENAVGEQSFRSVLILDPDDTATSAIPEGQVDHDVIGEFGGVISRTATATGTDTWSSPFPFVLEFDDLAEDVITARNMRHNAIGSAANPTFALSLLVYYTLEKVTDIDILNLLDIL